MSNFRSVLPAKAAELLGVSPRVVKVWGEQGLIHSWLLPNTKHRRFDIRSMIDFAIKNNYGLRDLARYIVYGYQVRHPDFVFVDTLESLTEQVKKGVPAGIIVPTYQDKETVYKICPCPVIVFKPECDHYTQLMTKS